MASADDNSASGCGPNEKNVTLRRSEYGGHAGSRTSRGRMSPDRWGPPTGADPRFIPAMMFRRRLSRHGHEKKVDRGDTY